MTKEFKIDATNAPILKYIENNLMVKDNLKQWQIDYFAAEESNPEFLKARCPNCGHLSIANVENQILVGSDDFVRGNQEVFQCGLCNESYDPYNSIAHEVLGCIQEFLEGPQELARVSMLRNCYKFHKGIKE